MKGRDQYIGRAQNLNLYGITIKDTRKDHLIDTKGKEYIDMLSSASSLTLGYARNDLVKAYVDQCGKVPHTCTVYTFVPIVEAYAKRLLKTSKIAGAKLLFGAFGSDVIDGAMKCAQAYTKKKGFIAFEKAYHGGTFLSLASNGFQGLKENLHLPDYFTHLPYPTKENSAKTLGSIKEILKKGDTAGLIMETVLGDGGILAPDPRFYKKIKRLLHEYGAVLIFDEIQTGVGRTGKFWGYENFGIKPDLFCSAKGLGAGYVALSACIGRAEIIDSLQNCQHAFTLAAHPGSCAIGLRVIEAIEEEKVLENVKKISKVLKKEFMKLGKSKYFDEVRGLGLMLGIALNSKKSIGPYIGKICLEKGVYVGYYGSKNNVLRIHPALTIDEKTAKEGAQKIIESVFEFEKNEKKYLSAGKFLSFFTT